MSRAQRFAESLRKLITTWEIDAPLNDRAHLWHWLNDEAVTQICRLPGASPTLQESLRIMNPERSDVDRALLQATDAVLRGLTWVQTPAERKDFLRRVGHMVAASLEEERRDGNQESEHRTERQDHSVEAEGFDVHGSGS
jgi:hypothetical protein